MCSGPFGNYWVRNKMWKRWWSNRTSTHVGMMLVKRNFLRWWHDWWRTTGTSTKVNIKESEEFHFFGTGFHKNQPKNANLFNLFRCRYDASTLRRSLCEDERRCSIRVIAEYCRLHVIVWTVVARWPMRALGERVRKGSNRSNDRQLMGNFPIDSVLSKFVVVMIWKSTIPVNLTAV